MLRARETLTSGLNPVCGNLLHHAIEMCLKGALAKRGYDLEQLFQVLGHDLKQLWRHYKKLYGAGLTKYNPTLADLRRYERLRYPDYLIDEGMQSTIHLGRGQVGLEQATCRRRREPSYDLRLAEIDDLFLT